MATNLRVEFYKRQHKRLSKSIVIDTSSSKKTCRTPGPDFPSKSIPSTPIAVVASSPDEKPSSIGDIPYYEMKKPFVFLENINEESFKCLNHSPLHPKLAYVPNWEEMFELLSHILFFTEREPLVHDMGVLFQATQQILVEVD
ncbi:hypothetical protein PVL29_007953 [Vitis rotundifolia]|uniref:Uncharacterized protein n=1 Tax=Vitis rotundifolia TaxID=103349 RepID=A0AA39A1A3_VITRO|nr:hypothetical protein PVL29_007953 [Vitis rotundifolia]